MVAKDGRCHGGEGLPNTLETWKARALAFREINDEVKAERERLTAALAAAEARTKALGLEET